MLEMLPCSATDRQIGSDWGWKWSKTTEAFWKKKKKLYFIPIYSRWSNVLPPTLIHSQQKCSREWCVRSKMAGCCCLSDKGNKILFRFSISPPLTTITGLEGVGQWLGLPGYRTSHQWTSSYGATLKPWFTHHQLILKKILLSILLRQQQPSIFECTHQSLLCCRMYLEVGDRVWTSALTPPWP